MNMKKEFCFAFLLLSAAAGAAELYVSPAGSDKNPGSAKAPFATIARAARAVKPGDTVKIGPGVYREQVTFRKSGKKGAPVTFSGTRGPKGEFLTVIESPGIVIDKWAAAPEVAPGVWKAKVAKRPNVVMMDGKMIALINEKTMALEREVKLPGILDENRFWGKWAPGGRTPGLDLLALPADIQVTHRYFGKRRELFWPVLNYVLSGWKEGSLYVRFANGDTPLKHKFTASFGEGFSLANVSHLKFTDLHMRGSRYQFHLTGKSSFITIENCLLMHGGARIRIDAGVTNTVVRNNIMTLGFIRDDLFGLRSSADMRGGLLYLIFKYIIGTSLSDDVGVTSRGSDTLITGNIILRGLIGIQGFGPKWNIHSNVIREMSSVGTTTGPEGDGEFHENLVMNCGIPIRIHRIREKRRDPLRTEYHYRNLIVQAPHGGTAVFVHCSSMIVGDDLVNFEKDKDGKMVYKKNPPNPVDPGRFYIYHNTFWGGQDGGYALMVDRLARIFNGSVMPFYFINNIAKFCPRHNRRWIDAMEGNLFYLFGPTGMEDKLRDPGLYKTNRSIGIVKPEKIWNNHGKYGLPDVTVSAGSPAAECGIDITRAQLGKEGRMMPKLPGFAPGYFKGKAPAAGAFQIGDSEEKFYEMHRRAEEASKMLRENR